MPILSIHKDLGCLNLAVRAFLLGYFFPNSGSYRVLVGSFDRYLRIPLQLVLGRHAPAETAR